MSAVKGTEVRSFIASHLADAFRENGIDEHEITDDLDLMKRGVIDSIGLIQLISDIEEQFNIEIDFEDMDTEYITVIGPVCAYIEEHAKTKGA